MNPKKSKITVLFLFITLAMMLFVAVIFYRATIERKLPRLQTSDVNTAQRGNIITKDGFSVATGQKLYKAMVDTEISTPIKKSCLLSFIAYTAAMIQTPCEKR